MMMIIDDDKDWIDDELMMIDDDDDWIDEELMIIDNDDDDKMMMMMIE